MIIRTTLWHNDRGDVVQVESAILADWWEPLVAHVLTCGPFDTPEERGLEALERCLAWYRAHGEQPQLFEELEAP